MRTYRGLAVSEEHQELSRRATAASPAKDVARLTLAGAHRAAAVDLPQEAEAYRQQRGTSEIIRTQIAERVLGLPRD
jgi:hypothetical protein